MKFIFTALILAFSATSFAKIPATDALKNLISTGEYEGRNESGKCLVTVNNTLNAATISIKTNNTSKVFTLVNSSLNYSVNEATSEISATQKLNSPFYLNGGKKILNVKANDIEQIQFSISTILLDHKGEDASTYSECTISL
jgi:hypothetical protein